MKAVLFAPSALRYGARRRLRNLLLAVALFLPAAVAAEPVTIAALGDSLTQGYGLPRDEGFVPQLQAWLLAQGADAVVLNAGVSGDTTAGGLARVDWTLTPEVDAVIVNLGGNDLLRGLDPAEARANLDAILARVTARGLPVLLVGLRAPRNFGADYKAAFDGMFPDLARQYGTLLTPGFLDPLVAETPTPETLKTYLQPDGIHPSAAGVAKIVAGIGPQVMELVERAKP